MDPIIGIIGFAVLFVLLFIGVPIAFSMTIVGLVGFAVLVGFGQSVEGYGIVAYSNTAHFVLACIPLFILMGQFAFHTGITEDLYNVIYKWLGAFPGGLAIASVFASAGFGAVTGSSVAAVATLGTIALPELNRHKYDPVFSCGTIAAAGTLGILIPPSIPMVLYGVLTEQSIGKLFIAGIIPGLLTAVVFSIMIYIRAKRNPALAPKGENFSWSERFRSLWKVWGVLSLFLLVVGGIFMGWFTPTEGAGIGAFGSFILLFALRKMSKKVLAATLDGSIRLVGMIVLILIGASVFAQFIAITGLNSSFADWVSALPVNRYIILIAILLIYLALGCVMDVIGMLVLTIPVIFPVIVKLGFDPIWFGVLVTVMIELSLITPPVGTNVIIIRKVSGLSMGQVFKGVGWFFLMECIVIALLVMFPSISTWLPELML
jgi:tripartite ATP-independent transporter DctM subunit